MVEGERVLNAKYVDQGIIGAAKRAERAKRRGIDNWRWECLVEGLAVLKGGSANAGRDARERVVRFPRLGKLILVWLRTATPCPRSRGIIHAGYFRAYSASTESPRAATHDTALATTTTTSVQLSLDSLVEIYRSHISASPPPSNPPITPQWPTTRGIPSM